MSPTARVKSDTTDTWANLVRTNRERLSLTQGALAQQLRVSSKTIMRWEGGSTRPDSMDLAKRAIKTLGMEPEQGLRAAGYGSDDTGDEPDPYAWIRDMGLDPNSRVVRYILSLDISDELRLASLKREREEMLRDETRRIENVRWVVDQQAHHPGARKAS